MASGRNLPDRGPGKEFPVKLPTPSLSLSLPPPSLHLLESLCRPKLSRPTNASIPSLRSPPSILPSALPPPPRQKGRIRVSFLSADRSRFAQARFNIFASIFRSIRGRAKLDDKIDLRRSIFLPLFHAGGGGRKMQGGRQRRSRFYRRRYSKYRGGRAKSILACYATQRRANLTVTPGPKGCKAAITPPNRYWVR